MKKVAIILVNWNGKQDTLNCISTLLKLDKTGINVEIIVVDNGSTNDSVAVIKNKYPDITLIDTKKNLGFSGGNNVGIKYALKKGIDYIWLLNNDTEVDKKALKELLTGFENSRAGILGSKIYFYPGKEFHFDRYKDSERGRVFWYAGGIIDWKNMYASHLGVDEVDHGQYDKKIITDYITGCSFMIKREVIEKIGLLDEKYFMYLEDLDYSLKAIHAGFDLVYVPKSIIWHVNAGSSARPGNSLQEYYITRNRIDIGMKYAPLRTKFALFRESLKFLASGSKIKKMAVIDAYSGKYGQRFIWQKK